MTRRTFACCLAGGAQSYPKPGPRDLCPVCGMLVSKYPNWAAVALWKDGSASHFDGAKDLFRLLRDLPRYGRRPGTLAAAAVTEFYDLKLIPVSSAWFVLGSDVLGPMGHELVPLGSLGDAEAFASDHKGSKIVREADITPNLLARLD